MALNVSAPEQEGSGGEVRRGDVYQFHLESSKQQFVQQSTCSEPHRGHGLACVQCGGAPALSGVPVRQVEAAGGVVVVGRPEGRRALVVELSADAAGTRLGLLTALGVEDGAAAVAPAITKTEQQNVRTELWKQRESGAKD